MLAATPFDHEAAILAIARGERFALRALYVQESRWLLGVAQRIVRERALAEDVLHDAFVQIWQHAGTYRPDAGSARGWVYTVVRHQAIKAVRDQRQEAMAPEEVAALGDSAQMQHDHAEEARARGLDAASVERCLQRLDDTQRHCVVSAFVEGHSHEHIAAALQRPVGTVKSWIRRSLVALKACLT